MDAQTAAEIAALPSMQALPLKRRFFALAYVRCQNATQAAKDAGYKDRVSYKGKNVATVQGGRLLSDAAVRDAVREGLAIRWRALHMGPDELLARAARIARHDHRKVGAIASITDLDDDTAEALQGVKVRREFDKNGVVKAETTEYRVASKLGAIELLAKYHRLLQPDVGAGDFGATFADAMERAGRRAALRDAAEAAEDAIVSGSGNPSGEGLPSAAGEAFAQGSER